MTSDEAVIAVIQSLNAAHVPYMITGSVASNLYGIARSTQDADFVLHATSEQMQEVLDAFRAPFRVDPQMSFETVTATTRHVVDVSGTPFKIELFYLSGDAHDRQRFERRVQGKVLGSMAWIPTPEDVIIWKLRWSKQGRRGKDVDDVRNVLAVQGDGLDFDYIHRWCDAHGTRELLDKIRATIPDDL